MSNQFIITAAVALVGGVAALAGWRRQVLSLDGFVAALAIGAVILALGGANWGILLLVFFATSSALSLLGSSGKPSWTLGNGARRRAVQVLANAGWGVALAVAVWLAPSDGLLAAFTGSMAAVTADTWATEIGTRYGGVPRMITNGQTVERGVSGGVTLVGLAASLAGAIAIGGLAGALVTGQPDGTAIGRWVLAGLGGGLAGSLADSWLGATAQALFFCPQCQKVTETQTHRCGATAIQLKGWRWMTNDTVNLAASIIGSGVAWAIYGCLG